MLTLNFIFFNKLKMEPSTTGGAEYTTGVTLLQEHQELAGAKTTISTVAPVRTTGAPLLFYY